MTNQILVQHGLIRVVDLTVLRGVLVLVSFIVGRELTRLRDTADERLAGPRDLSLRLRFSSQSNKSERHGTHLDDINLGSSSSHGDVWTRVHIRIARASARREFLTGKV